MAVRLHAAGSSVQPPPLGRYRHFKGAEYELIEVGRHTETGDLLVVYRPCADPEQTWIRPLEMFLDVVERGGHRVPRFTFVS
jgi:hypothetical protein